MGPIRAHFATLPPSERFNLWTHAGGALAALVGGAFLVARATSPLAVVAFGVYGLSLVLLYAASATHHALPPAPGRKERLRRLDHISIYALIMGTYAPPCLLLLPPSVGWPLLGVVWLLGAGGIVLKATTSFAPRWITVTLYIALGWSAVFAARPIVQLGTSNALYLLGGGGLVYTLGAIVYATKKPDLWPRYVGFHGLWHVLVLVASALQFAFVALYVPTG